MAEIKTVLTDGSITAISRSFGEGRTQQWMRDFSRAIEAAVLSANAGKVAQPELTVVVRSYPESNGKRNWTATMRPVQEWDGLVGSCGGISLAHGECWNRVAYEAERARFMLGLRDEEPFILDYGDDIETPDQWKGESGRVMKRAAPTQQAIDAGKV